MPNSGGIGDTSLRWDNQVTSPFDSLAREVYPRTIHEAFAWAEEMWMHHGLYSQAIRKAVRYFMTELEIEGEDVDNSARQKYLAKVKTMFDVLEELATVGDDYMSFGNSFTSVHTPFTRSLICKGTDCGFKAPLREMKPYFRFENGEFKGKCPICGHQGPYAHEDTKKTGDDAQLKVTRWPPQYMELKQHPISKRTIYSLDINRYDYLREGIQSGDMLFLEDTPWEIIEAIYKNAKFEFNEDQIFHMAFPALACCAPALRGWGMPPMMSDFETALIVQMLDKYNQTILVDYLMPFRVLSPPSGDGTIQGDPMLQVNMQNFSGQVTRMIDRHRQNPTDWNFLPFPLQYQVLGGEASDLTPTDMLEHYELRLLHAMGIPPEFYKSSFSNNTGPIIAFRMFERSWQHFANMLNKWATWLVRKQGEAEKWEKVRAKLTPVSMYEDPQNTQIKLQLAAANEISRQTAYAPLGLDLKEERQKIMDEEDDFGEAMEQRQKETEKRQANAEAARVPGPGETILQNQEMAAQGAGGMAGAPAGAAPPAGGAPPPAGGGAPGGGAMGASIDELMMQADQEAQTLLTMPPYERRKRLVELKHSNEALHAQVKSRLAQLEQMASQQGLQLVRQGQAPPPQEGAA